MASNGIPAAAGRFSDVRRAAPLAVPRIAPPRAAARCPARAPPRRAAPAPPERGAVALRSPAQMSLEDVRSGLSSFAEAREWGQFHTPRNVLLALVGEASPGGAGAVARGASGL
jgi:hypothetical protein